MLRAICLTIISILAECNEIGTCWGCDKRGFHVIADGCWECLSWVSIGVRSQEEADPGFCFRGSCILSGVFKQTVHDEKTIFIR